MCIIHPHIPLHLKTQTVGWWGRLLDSTIWAVSHTLFNIESHFEPPYINIYHIGLSDGAVSCYTHRLEIYGAALVIIWAYVTPPEISEIDSHYQKNFRIRLHITTCMQGVYQSYISYKSLYLKNGPIKTHKVLSPLSIGNLYFLKSNKENSYKHAR